MDRDLFIMIVGMSLFFGNQNATLIHKDYDLTTKHRLNMMWHAVIGFTMAFGIFFRNPHLVQLHLALVLMAIASWFWHGGCFMAQWERENIPYTPRDLELIQRPADRRTLEFFMLMVPYVLIDLSKLRGSL
jgi:hypothetical protein